MLWQINPDQAPYWRVAILLYGGFFSHAGGGEQVGIAEFVGVPSEIAHLDPAFFNQSFKAEVNAADVDAKLFGQGALGDAEVVLQQLESSKQSVVVRSLAASGHFLLVASLWRWGICCGGAASAKSRIRNGYRSQCALRGVYDRLADNVHCFIFKQF
jgi:hypothetical protein